MPGVSWPAAPSHRLKKNVESALDALRHLSIAVACSRHSTCHSASGKERPRIAGPVVGGKR
jgi:hypothetical protein